MYASSRTPSSKPTPPSPHSLPQQLKGKSCNEEDLGIPRPARRPTSGCSSSWLTALALLVLLVWNKPGAALPQGLGTFCSHSLEGQSRGSLPLHPGLCTDVTSTATLLFIRLRSESCPTQPVSLSCVLLLGRMRHCLLIRWRFSIYFVPLLLTQRSLKRAGISVRVSPALLSESGTELHGKELRDVSAAERPSGGLGRKRACPEGSRRAAWERSDRVS